MLYFGNTKKEYTTRNYKAVKVDNEGEPNFIMEIEGNYKLFLVIDEEGFTRACDLSETIDDDFWRDIVDNIYEKEFNSHEIIEYYEDFDITITKRN